MKTSKSGTGAATRRTAKKRFGQHFLERTWVAKVLQAVGPQPDDTFLEIGPGHGALTGPLTEVARKVVAFEIDRDLVRALDSQKPANLTIVEGDFLDRSLTDVRDSLTPTDETIRAVGNLPYNVAAPILFALVRLYAEGLPLRDATVMLQREVADRLLARPGTKDYGSLSILIGHWATVERRLNLPPGAFRPAPKVHSSVVTLRFHPATPPATDESQFQRLVQSVFTRRRKMLSNALLAFAGSDHLPPINALAHAGIDGRRRPETLEISELVRLSDVYSSSRAVL